MTELNLLIEDRPQRIDVLMMWLPRIGVALAFLGFGWQKFEGDRMWIRIFDQIGFGQWFRYFTGAIQITGALLVLIPKTFLAGIAMLACTMAGAMTYWIVWTGSVGNAIIPGIVLVALLAVAAPGLLRLRRG